uniref:Tubby C-terminal domain-containing protein n=1 Tax=Ananas comosus var. bracteatus TaxID=296719 RepID=A0A6V7PRA8_ANACO|nr:unnamed protein product [Ananas comosus var. bracteatus]
MSFRSIIQDMRDEIGNISRKGIEVKIGYGLRSRSHRAVVANAPPPPPVDALGQSCWASMPPELLRDVLLARYHEGDCEDPEVSGKLTFPISLKQPGPRDFPLQCFIKRNRATQTYYLYLGLTQALTDDGKFLLAARKCRRPTCTDYLISLDVDDMSKGSSTYIGKLRSNFFGTKFTVYDAQPPYDGAIIAKCRSTRVVGSKQVSPRIPAGNYPVAHISYELNVLGSRGPRRMHCVVDSIPASAIEPGGSAPTQTEFPLNSLDSFPSIPFFRSKSARIENLPSPFSGQKEAKLVLKNKAPRWHEQLQCWCLNFRGRVTVASVKNFQLVASEENGPASQEEEKVILQFGKVGKDLFTMDYRYPYRHFRHSLSASVVLTPK